MAQHPAWDGSWQNSFGLVEGVVQGGPPDPPGFVDAGCAATDTHCSWWALVWLMASCITPLYGANPGGVDLLQGWG
jgi:hypothetical protein